MADPGEAQRLRSRSGRGWCFAILILYALFGLATSLLWPLWEEIDERRHYQRAYAYVNEVTPPRSNWELNQPQLYYRLMSWPLKRLFKLHPKYMDAFRPAAGRLGQVPRVEWSAENYRFLLGPHLLRWLNLIFGGLALYLIYRAALRFAPESSVLAPTAMALVGLSPSFLHFNATVSNDALAALAGAFLFWLLSSVRSQSVRWPEVGLMAGAGLCLPLLVKLTVLPIGLAVIFAAVWRLRSYWRSHRGLLLLGSALLLAGVTVGLVVFAPEAARTLWVNLTVRSLYIQPGVLANLGNVPVIFGWRYWGTFSHLEMGVATQLARALTLLLLIGWLASLRLLRAPGKRAWPGSRAGWSMVWLAAGLALLVVGKNALATGRYQGRYLFPSLGALSLLATAGWQVLLVPRTTRYMPHATVALMLGLNLFVWFCELIPLYYQPLLG